MDDTIERAVERAVRTMHDRLGDPVTIDDLARAALFSKFHFVRIFQRTTGVSPGRFMSAIRLQRAKELLISTSLRVADISALVGYSSVGTFSSRFNGAVGLSPAAFRRQGGHVSHISSGPAPEQLGMPAGVVHGSVWAPSADPGLTFIGLFADRMPAGRPVRCAVLDRPGEYRLDAVPDGTWYLLAQSVSTRSLELAAAYPFRDEDLAVGSSGPVVISGATVRRVDLTLKPVNVLDPPVLLALLDVRKGAAELVSTA